MSVYGFSLTLIFPYKGRIYNSVFIRENAGQGIWSEKTRILEFFEQWEIYGWLQMSKHYQSIIVKISAKSPFKKIFINIVIK